MYPNGLRLTMDNISFLVLTVIFPINTVVINHIYILFWYQESRNVFFFNCPILMVFFTSWY